MPTKPTRICIETGKTWIFASAVDWPGWARRGKGEQEAIEALDEYTERYGAVVALAGTSITRFSPGPFEVTGRVPGTPTTDFGAPDARGPWDDEPLHAAERSRQIDVLRACWAYFDAVVAAAPPTLRKGPRGGGRDRDPMVDHVAEAERAYASRLGTRVPPRTAAEERRGLIVAALRSGEIDGAKWPVRYGIRRAAWHVLDHAWEIEDKSQ